jgi:hypothetical protein
MSQLVLVKRLALPERPGPLAFGMGGHVDVCQQNCGIRHVISTSHMTCSKSAF